MSPLTELRSTGHELVCTERSPLTELAVTGAAAPSMLTSPLMPETSIFTPRASWTTNFTATSLCSCPLTWTFMPREAVQEPSALGHTAQIIVPDDVGNASTVTLFGSELSQLFSVV